jgi:hypothetical protein
VFNPAYPHASSTGATAFLSGVDHNTGLPTVQRCDAAFACSGAATVGAQKDMARLYVSPHVDGDGTLFAATSKGFFHSGDGGRSFAPMTVQPPGANTLITTVQGVAFTPDFDASKRTGRALVALISVSGASGHPGTTSGGVYGSSDGTSWARVGGAGPLDSGAAGVAVAPDGRIIAGWVGFRQGKLDGGLLCSVAGGPWQASCPGGPAAGGSSPGKAGGPAGAAGAGSGSAAGATGQASASAQAAADGAAADGATTPVAATPATATGRRLPVLGLAAGAVAVLLALAGALRLRLRRGREVAPPP